MDKIEQIVNTNKRIIFIPIGIFVFFIIATILFQKQKTDKTSTQSFEPTPTIIRTYLPQKDNEEQLHTSASSASIETYAQQKPIVSPPAFTAPLEEGVEKKLELLLPIQTDDFMAEYSLSLKKVIITTKTDNAPEAVKNWAKKQQIESAVYNPNIVIITDKSPREYENSVAQAQGNTYRPEDQLSNLFNVFNALLSIPSNTASSPESSLFPSLTDSTPTPKTLDNFTPLSSKGLIYYSQCDSVFDEYALPNGCTICKAGCGPTSASMILSSYVDKKYNPSYVVNIYKNANKYLGCSGSYMSDAKAILEQNGIITTDYIISGKSYTSKEVVEEFRNYIKGGWTLFVLTYFCENGCGHFFWITEIGPNGEMYAFDPYYGKNQPPPINENSRYPFPKYRYAFGVKKK